MPPGGELREVKANVLKEELSVGFMKTSQSSNHLKVREHQWRSFIHSLSKISTTCWVCRVLRALDTSDDTADTDTCS